ncbi:XRE family transcriptional regulator [Kutzneria sp. NPDC051319]|uniref:helix-turn-helix domain-containing protein n=1 Tax=Kutzneria sp. NPDC051319 TaxID=3155047 RepID=UPI00341DF49F
MAAQGWSTIGDRVRTARTGTRRTQDEVADALRIDRSSVVRLEAGQRKVSALELAALAELFDVPLSYFLSPHADAVVSRRSAVAENLDEAARAVWRLDVDLEDHASSIRWLIGRELIEAPEIRMTAATPTDVVEAEALAREARARLGVDGPLPALADVCERFGLYLLVVDRDADGASMLLDEVDGLGAAVIGGQADPGRRRSTAAHELGHHLFGDAYSSDVGISTDDRERVIDAFAREFLLPASALRHDWPVNPDQHWTALVRLAGTFRVSWKLAVLRACDLGLIDTAERQALDARTPVLGDFLAQLGTEPVRDLPVGATGAVWKRAVLAAYRRSLITGVRALQLLHGAAHGPEDLPSRCEDDTP